MLEQWKFRCRLIQRIAPKECEGAQSRKSTRGPFDGAADRFEIGCIVVNQGHPRYQRGCRDDAIEAPADETVLS